MNQSAANQSAADPHGQTQYQVRFDWGVAGARAVALDADVVIWVDAIPSDNPPPVIDAAEVVAGSFRNRTAVAAWVLDRQGDKGDRFVVAVIAAGDQRAGGAIRFTLEDLLAAGAVIDSLADAGIDYCSPESAAASAAFTGLRHAIGPLVAASGTGQELRARGDADLAKSATDLDADQSVKGMGSSATAFASGTGH